MGNHGMFVRKWNVKSALKKLTGVIEVRPDEPIYCLDSSIYDVLGRGLPSGSIPTPIATINGKSVFDHLHVALAEAMSDAKENACAVELTIDDRTIIYSKEYCKVESYRCQQFLRGSLRHLRIPCPGLLCRPAHYYVCEVCGIIQRPSFNEGRIPKISF
jgi:hypothetical protein